MFANVNGPSISLGSRSSTESASFSNSSCSNTSTDHGRKPSQIKFYRPAQMALFAHILSYPPLAQVSIIAPSRKQVGESDLSRHTSFTPFVSTKRHILTTPSHTCCILTLCQVQLHCRSRIITVASRAALGGINMVRSRNLQRNERPVASA